MDIPPRKECYRCTNGVLYPDGATRCSQEKELEKPQEGQVAMFAAPKPIQITDKCRLFTPGISPFYKSPWEHPEPKKRKAKGSADASKDTIIG